MNFINFNIHFDVHLKPLNLYMVEFTLKDIYSLFLKVTIENYAVFKVVVASGGITQTISDFQIIFHSRDFNLSKYCLKK